MNTKQPAKPSHYYSISVSGGKDSTALALLAKENEWPCTRIYADTGWESSITYEYLDYLREKIGPIEVVRAPEQWIARMDRLGAWPNRTRRWCTRQLKMEPLMKWHHAFKFSEGFDTLVNCTGIRADESAKRACYEELEWSTDFGCWAWRPLLRWTVEDVLQMHRRHGVKVNPLYQAGFERVGCWPCIYAGKLELRLLAEKFPERLEELVALEERYWKPDVENTIYSLRRPGSEEHVPTRLREVVEWAKTSHGGVQQTMFAPASGCQRWGLCEIAENTDDDLKPGGEE